MLSWVVLLRSMDRSDLIALGLDTSNYRTSVAAVSLDGMVLANARKLLDVPLGKRGLRQSEALFQHVNNLPALVRQVMDELGERRRAVCCVSASTKPRPVEGSYMPVFNAGITAASMLADTLDVPMYRFSHQEGHIAAVRAGSPAEEMRRFVSFHLSGGTTEAVLVDESGPRPTYSIIGGTRDISYGQLLDRVAVAMGMAFPGGEEMDQIALSTPTSDVQLPRIKVTEGYFHLSGLESHCQRVIAAGEDSREGLILALFQEIAASMKTMMIQLKQKQPIEGFLFAGGVASSRFIREQLSDWPDIVFGNPQLSGDNAVGIAYLGGRAYGSQTHQCLTTE